MISSHMKRDEKNTRPVIKCAINCAAMYINTTAEGINIKNVFFIVLLIIYCNKDQFPKAYSLDQQDHLHGNRYFSIQDDYLCCPILRWLHPLFLLVSLGWSTKQQLRRNHNEYSQGHLR